MEHHKPFRWFKATQLPEVDVNKPDELIEQEPFERYLSDQFCISSSGIKALLQSPQHFLAQLSGLQDDQEEKDHLKFGRAAHCLILEPERFRQLYVVEPEFTGLTKDGRESRQSGEARKKREQWRADLHPMAEVITQDDMDHLICMVDSLMAHPQAKNLLSNGKPEVTGRWTHKSTGVRIRIRPDYLTVTRDAVYITDIKTSRDPSVELFSRDMSRLRYQVQLALYKDGVEQILGRKVEAVALLAMEKSPPYTVNLFWLNDEDLELGRRWYEYGLDLYKKCLRLDQWPPAQVNGQMINLPTWAHSEALPMFEFKEGKDVQQAAEDEAARGVLGEGQRD